jgi:hypothetical protein
MSDDDLWRPKEADESGSSGPPPEADAGGVGDETQPITGASSAPPEPTPPSATPPGPSYAPPVGPPVGPPPGPPSGPTPQNPYGAPYTQPYSGQPYGAQQPYPGQPYGAPPNPYRPPSEYATPQSPYGSPYHPAYAGGMLPDHPSATTAMVLGIISLVGIVCCGGVTLLLSPAAWIVGAKAVREIDATPGRYGGRDRAQAGKIMGIIGTVLLALAVIAVIGLIALAVATDPSGPTTPVTPTPSFQNG